MPLPGQARSAPRVAFRQRSPDEIAAQAKALIQNIRSFPYSYQVVVFADPRGLWWCRAHGWREQRLSTELPEHEVGYYNRGVTHEQLLEDVLFVARASGWLQE